MIAVLSMAEKRNTTATIALCLSIGSLSFAVYQWSNGQSETRINAAIEISKTLPAELPQAVREALNLLILKKALSEDQISDLLDMAVSFEYLANLANNKRVATEYLSATVKCRIWLSNQIVNLLRPRAGVEGEDFTQLQAFSRRVEDQCKPRYPFASNLSLPESQ
jgi:hypothetical protein